jgi:hypothetical protein
MSNQSGMAERFQRGLQRALNSPPQHSVRLRSERNDPLKTEAEAIRQLL